MQKFIASTLLFSALAVPALAQYGDSSGSSSSSMAMVSSTMAATKTASGASATHTVQVGASGFVYSPDSVTAAKGDILEFHFTGTNLHDVVQGTFSKPCENNNGIYSGYPSTSDVFQVTVNSTDPMWMYCSTPGHCQGGMAMVVNQAGSNTLAAYKSAAQGASGSNSPVNAQGGTVIAISALSAGASSTSGGMATATTSAATSSSSSAAIGAAETMSSTFKNIALAIGLPMMVWLMD